MNNYNEGKLVYPEYSHITNRNYIVDIAEIVKQKHKIPMQYETINVGGNPDDLHQLSKKLDRYFLHIIEEIAEFLEEIDKMKLTKSDYLILKEDSNKDCLMELIDVAAYISSVISILYIDMYGLENVAKGEYYDTIEKHFIIDMCDYEAIHFKEPMVDTINKELMNVEKILMLDVRRLFPERKWHKDVNRTLSIFELDTLYEKCINSCSKALVGIISMFLYLTDNNYELFNKLFLEKNEIVYSLKK